MPKPQPRARREPPEITPLDRYPLNVNDKQASDRVAEAFRRHFPADRVAHTGPAPASEDFGCFGTEWHAPSVFWFVGGTDPDIYAKAKAAGRLNELPVNHSPHLRARHSSDPGDRRRGAGRRARWPGWLNEGPTNASTSEQDVRRCG